ncbi:hypothetical protein DFH06DRAFT_693423 [Mycena polygramma]|nr:hypothetical protein DFH06DRAFT_693423 [Mycena polygramma]
MQTFVPSSAFVLVFLATLTNTLSLPPVNDSQLARRATREFIGFHGTNSKTAQLWKTQGFIVKPPSKTGKSKADQELDPGLYVADVIHTAAVFAYNNAKFNPGTDATICAIFAKDASQWQGFNKVQAPDSLIRLTDNKFTEDELRAARTCYIRSFGSPPFSPQNTLVFSDWAAVGSKERSGQVVLPDGFGPFFTAECFAAKNVQADFSVPAGVLPAGAVLPGPKQLFHAPEKMLEWNINPIDLVKSSNCQAAVLVPGPAASVKAKPRRSVDDLRAI